MKHEFCRDCHRSTAGVIVRIKGVAYCAACGYERIEEG